MYVLKLSGIQMLLTSQRMKKDISIIFDYAECAKTLIGCKEIVPTINLFSPKGFLWFFSWNTTINS